MDPRRKAELDELLDDLSYQVTAARAAGVDRPEDLRKALKRLAAIVANLDALAVTEISERRKA